MGYGVGWGWWGGVGATEKSSRNGLGGVSGTLFRLVGYGVAFPFSPVPQSRSGGNQGLAMVSCGTSFGLFGKEA